MKMDIKAVNGDGDTLIEGDLEALLVLQTIIEEALEGHGSSKASFRTLADNWSSCVTIRVVEPK